MALNLDKEGAKGIAVVLSQALRSVSHEFHHNGYKREADFLTVDRPRVAGHHISIVLQAQQHPVLSSA